MKSSIEDLKKRGYATEEEIDELKGKTEKELIELLNSKIAWIRTAAASNLIPSNDNVVSELLSQLSVEKSLYTKIAICECLEKGDKNTANQMVKYLGKIGKNQYKDLPDKVSLKKSYPLPRDIIARSLGKMSGDVFPALLDILKNGDIIAISEVIDAIGFMVFYNPQLATIDNEKEIFIVMDKYKSDDLIVWKSILCLSAFPLEDSIDILKKYKLKNDIFGEEAKRSLCLINIII